MRPWRTKKAGPPRGEPGSHIRSTGGVTGRRPRRSNPTGREGRSFLTTESNRVERSGGPLDGGRRFTSRSRFRGRGSLLFGRGFATAAAIATAATAIAATVAAAVATTVAATVATASAATVATTTVAIATTVATLATVASGMATAVTAVAALAAVATMTGLRRLGAAHQRQTDDREENRDTKGQNTIHPRCLLETSTLRKAQHRCRRTFAPPAATAPSGGIEHVLERNSRSSRPARPALTVSFAGCAE